METTFFADLLAIQKELKTITKNKKAFKGSYADIENIWEGIREVVNNHNFVVIHEANAEGVKTIALHSQGKELSSFIPWSGNKDAQEQGKEITYAKRYNINAIFNVIVADEDTDASKEKGNYKKSNVDGSLAAKKLLEAKDRDTANGIYMSLSKDERLTQEVISAIDTLKTKFK